MIRKILRAIPGLKMLLLPTGDDIKRKEALVKKQKNTPTGSRDSFGNFYAPNGRYAGHKALNGMFRNEHGDYVGKMNSDGTFHDRFGHYAGRVTRHGHLLGKEGNFLGILSKSGAVTGKNGQLLGQVPPGHEAAAFSLVFGQTLSSPTPIPTPAAATPLALPLLGICAPSGTGKTTLLRKLLPRLEKENIRAGLIKHSHHEMDIDIPGKDSYELRRAGAQQVIVASQKRWAMITETPQGNMPDLQSLAQKMDFSSLDLILVEGFKHEPIPKIQLFRTDFKKNAQTKPGIPSDYLRDPHIIAIACETEEENHLPDISLPVLNLNDPDKICAFIQHWLAKRQNEDF